jgi:signal transduction histidine kinase
MRLRAGLFLFFSLKIALVALAFQTKSQIDSLVASLKNIENQKDTQYVNLLNLLAFELRNTDNQKALAYGLEAEKLAEKLNYTQGLMKAKSHLGWIFYRRDDTQNAFSYATQAMQMAQELGDIEEQINNLNTIGTTFSDQEEYNLAIKHLQEATRLSNSKEFPYLYSRSYNNLAYAYIEKNELDSALFYTEKALSIGKENNFPYTVGFALRNLGDIYKRKQEYEKALDAYQQVVSYAKEYENNFILISTYVKIASIYLQIQQDNLAYEYLLIGIEIGKKYYFPYELHIAYKLMSDLYRKKQDIKNAFYYQTLYIQLKDSITKIEKQTYIIENEFSKKEKQALSEENIIKQAEIIKKNIWLLVAIFLLFAAGVFALLLFRNMNQKKEAYKIVLQQRNEIAEQNEKIKLQTEHLQQLNQTKDKILGIISHDLRNPIANLYNLLELFENKDIDIKDTLTIASELQKNIGTLQNTLNSLLHWAYAQINGLQTQKEVFDIQKVVLELHEFFALYLLKKNIALDCQIVPQTIVYADQDQVALVLRNLIANAIKFTPKNGKITLWAKEKQGEMLMCVSDTGIGISSEKINMLFEIDKSVSTKGTEGEKGTGLGLLLCKEFVEKNGGTIWAESEIGKGTDFYFTLPLPAQEKIRNTELEKSTLTL